SIMISPQKLWAEYNRLGELRARSRRGLSLAGLFFCASILLLYVQGWPSHPHRGALSGIFDNVLLATYVIVQILVSVFVVDATLLCRKLVQVMGKRPSKWPDPVLANCELSSVDHQFLHDWLDIRLLAERTKEITSLIYIPFIMLLG